MVTMLSMISDIIKGAIVVIFVFFVAYGVYRAIKMLIPKAKPTDEIYNKVAEHINSGEPFSSLAEHFSKFKWKEQQRYINAYVELSKLKGGIK